MTYRNFLFPFITAVGCFIALPAAAQSQPASASTPPESPQAAPLVAAPEQVAPALNETTRRRSSVAMVSGIVLAGAGALAIVYVGGTAMGGDHDDTARGLVLGGVIALAISVPLIIYGAKRVPADSSTAIADLPRWAGEPSARGWSWRF